MKKAVLVHGWGGHPENHWFPWLKKELEAEAWEVFVPELPDSENPSLEAWISALNDLGLDLDENLFLVGHSLGVPTILRFLGSLPQGKKVGGVLMVAGIAEDLGIREISEFFHEPWNWEKIRSHSGRFLALHSDDDPYEPLRLPHAELFQHHLVCEAILMSGMKHFSGGLRTLPLIRNTLFAWTSDPES